MILSCGVKSSSFFSAMVFYSGSLLSLVEIYWLIWKEKSRGRLSFFTPSSGVCSVLRIESWLDSIDWHYSILFSYYYFLSFSYSSFICCFISALMIKSLERLFISILISSSTYFSSSLLPFLTPSSIYYFFIKFC